MTLGKDDWPTIESVSAEMSPSQCAKFLANVSQRVLFDKNPDLEKQLREIPKYQMFLYCVHAVARRA